MAQKKPFLLRLNQETWEELERWAAEEFRSVNGQIEFILHEAIGKQRKRNPRPGGDSAAPNPHQEES